MDNPVGLMGLQVSRRLGLAGKLAGLARMACECGEAETEDSDRSEWSAVADLVMALAADQVNAAEDAERRMEALRSMEQALDAEGKAGDGQ